MPAAAEVSETTKRRTGEKPVHLEKPTIVAAVFFPRIASMPQRLRHGVIFSKIRRIDLKKFLTNLA
jgi:hypothetical protein